MACIFTNKVVFSLAFSLRSGADQCATSCAYAEYVLRTFNMRYIRSEYAVRRLAMRYAYASHTLKTSRGTLAYDNVCERLSYLQKRSSTCA